MSKCLYYIYVSIALNTFSLERCLLSAIHWTERAELWVSKRMILHFFLSRGSFAYTCVFDICEVCASFFTADFWGFLVRCCCMPRRILRELPREMKRTNRANSESKQCRGAIFSVNQTEKKEEKKNGSLALCEIYSTGRRLARILGFCLFYYFNIDRRFVEITASQVCINFVMC